MVDTGKAELELEIEGQLLGFLTSLFSEPICALEWGNGRFLAGLRRRAKPGGVFALVTRDARVFAEAEHDLDPREPGQHVLFVPPAERTGASDAETRDALSFALRPVLLDRTFHLVFVGPLAGPACVAMGWLLLRQAGLLVALGDGADQTFWQATPRGAFLVRVSESGSDRQAALACKDPALGQPLVAALGACLPGRFRVEALPPTATAAGVDWPQRVEVLGAQPLCGPVRPPLPASGTFTPSCLFIHTYYPAFLAAHYRRHPGLASASYAVQKASLQASCFGDSDFYSHGLTAAGWQADDIIVNCEPLQMAWAREAGFKAASLMDIAVEQVRRTQPHAVYLHDLALACPAMLQRIRPHVDLVLGQIASPLPPDSDPRGLDVLFTSLPHFATRFRAQGITAYYQPLAFEPRVLDRVPQGERVHPVTFVGGVSVLHSGGNRLLEAICADTPLELWGYGVERLPEDSLIRKRHRGESWGLDMFAILRRSRLTLNRHAEFAETHANNMRLFEATGCGALLLTDYKDNLQDLFEIGQEVVAFRSPEEAAALVHYYLIHPQEAAAIARAGQRRTLQEHTYGRRMKDTAEILLGHLRRKRDEAHLRAVDLGEISTALSPMAPEELTPELTSAWKHEALPIKQRALVNRELGAMYRGRPIASMEALVKTLRPVLGRDTSLLEIGCSSGYHREVLRYLLDGPFPYTGADYSPAMIAMARAYHPDGDFLVADGAFLPFASQAFTVAVSAGVILHTPNYEEHLRETVRVARDYVILHRTPVCRKRPTQHHRKKGYGVDMLELVFNEDELGSLLERLGLKLVDRCEFHANPTADAFAVTYRWQKAA